jgi:hypothetical protein
VQNIDFVPADARIYPESFLNRTGNGYEFRPLQYGHNDRFQVFMPGEILNVHVNLRINERLSCHQRRNKREHPMGDKIVGKYEINFLGPGEENRIQGRHDEVKWPPFTDKR